MTREPESGDPLAFRPLPHGLAYLLLGLLVALLVLARVGMPLLMVAGLGVLGTLTVIGLAIVRGRQFDGADQISEAGVRGPTLFGPVFIPWSEVVPSGRRQERCDSVLGAAVSADRPRRALGSAATGAGALRYRGGRAVYSRTRAETCDHRAVILPAARRLSVN